MTRSALFAVLTLVCAHAAASPARVEDVRVWSGPDHTRIVFDVSESVQHELFTLKDPARVVVDVARARLKAGLPEMRDSDRIQRLRSGRREGGELRVVVDLERKLQPRSFTLEPQGRHGHRLVLDLNLPDGHDERAVKSAQRDRGEGDDEIVVAIDAGHGGEDPGAVGPSGTREKHIVMQIAERLDDLVDGAPDMQGVLTREGDYYLSLRERIVKARKRGADLFLSIHADAFKDPRARGASVYALSERGASDEAARWLAERENASDLAGGVSLDNKDEDLASVLLDLSQTATIDASLTLGEDMLAELDQVARLHKHEVLQARFVVLKSPDIPSILVETGFISNPAEERNLRRAAHRRKLARAMLRGIEDYFAEHGPPGRVAGRDAREHVVREGDTLSAIARRYQVSVGQLRSVNDIDPNDLRVGEVVTIPASAGS